MKTNAIIRIVLFSLAIVLLLGILVSAIGWNLYIVDGKVQIDTDSVEPLEQIGLEYVTSDIRNIEIEWVAGSITFQEEPNITEIQISETCPVGTEYTMVCKQSGQTLKIKFCDQDFDLSFPSLGFNAEVSKDLVILVPSDWECKSLEIDTGSAELIMSDMTIQEFDFDGASGDCRITNCDIGEMDIDTASGNVTFTGTLDTLECDAASADCGIEVYNIPRSIKLDAMSGDLELILPPNAGFTCNVDAMSSSFDTDFECVTEKDAYICGDGSCKIQVSAMSGDVSILKGIE